MTKSNGMTKKMT